MADFYDSQKMVKPTKQSLVKVCGKSLQVIGAFFVVMALFAVIGGIAEWWQGQPHWGLLLAWILLMLLVAGLFFSHGALLYGHAKQYAKNDSPAELREPIASCAKSTDGDTSISGLQIHAMNADTDEQLLDELRSQTALLQKIRRTNVLIISTLGILTLIFFHYLITPKPARHSGDSWDAARDLLDDCEHNKARDMLHRLIDKNPNYYYGYGLLGSLNLELGNWMRPSATTRRHTPFAPKSSIKRNW